MPVSPVRHGAPTAPEPTPALSSADFARVRDLIHRRAGIWLNPGKAGMVLRRLMQRLRCLGCTDIGAYLDTLDRSPADAPELQEFVNALTTNLTSFFREPYHFPLLGEHLKRLARRAPLRLWCAAASTGEEPYTMAITAMEVFGTLSPPISILATDIDTSVLATARAGIYRDEQVARIDLALLRRYFQRGTGAKAGLVRVRPELRALVDFRPLNLLDAKWPMTTPFDAIFCRNVLIYFDKDTQRRVLERLAGLLGRDSLLFAGHSESAIHARELFEPLGQTVYRLAGAHQCAVTCGAESCSTHAGK